MEMDSLDPTAAPSHSKGLDGVGIPSYSLGSVEAESSSGPNLPVAGQTSAGPSDSKPVERESDPKASGTGEASSSAEARNELPKLPSPGAIGPSVEQPAFGETEGAGPALMITLLLTTGARHPYKIDRKYLKKRNVNATNEDPFNLSVYTLKELIWREWREEWETRPSNPSSIRLIHFGHLLDDKSPLNECRFNAETANVVHMTVRPQEVVDEEDAKTAKQDLGRDRDRTERRPACRCVIL
ncbi:MAG: hypothetical protein M1832_005517 [Thelocarpon impressellum]|nr:MAG: hypothetical protein M1832_005517 [Thelocarpon impressellum]